jgi:hypothetical protein
MPARVIYVVGLKTIMSHYDIVKKRLNKLQRFNLIVTLIPTILVVVIGAKWAWGNYSYFIIFLLSLVALLTLPLGFQFVFKQLFPRYSILLNELHKIQSEVTSLRHSVDTVYDKYRLRNKGEQFKRAYELVGKWTKDCEEGLAVGMSREQKEVFVTCFIKAEEVVRVTASIGSVFRCSAADDPRRWRQHIERLNCDEIRQYHNHPINNNRTCPSPVDYKTSLSLKKILGHHGNKLRSFIIYWNEIREWRIMEYDEKGKHSLIYEFDVAAQPSTPAVKN